MSRKTLIWGSFIGIIAPFFGIFLGLQVHPIIGNIFSFPLIIVSRISSTPFGQMNFGLRLLGLTISVVCWIAIVFFLKKLFSKTK